MADSFGRPSTNRDTENQSKPLSYAFDAGFLSGTHPPDTPCTVDVDDEGPFYPTSPDSESSGSLGESNRWANLSASVRMFSESLLRMELAEMEMLKAREASRVKAERRRVESEAEMTQMLLDTQLQIASFLSRKTQKRKRKRIEEENSSTSEREGLLLLGLLQGNLNF